MTSNLRRIFVILTLAAFGMAALLSLLPAAGHDQLWFLLMSRRWLRGAQLYGPEVFDSNPPAIIWLGTLPIFLGRVLHVETTFAAKLLVTLTESTVSLLSFRLLTYASHPNPDVSGTPFMPSSIGHEWGSQGPEKTDETNYRTIALLFAAVVIFYILPARDFGQREHILSFLILPYILAAAIPHTRRITSLRILAGLLAGIAICLKPQQALLPIAIELTLFLTTKSRVPRPYAASSRMGGSEQSFPTRLKNLLRPEPILILLVGLAYLAAIRHFAPLYFTKALPILRDTYWAVGHLNPLQLAIEAIELLILAAISITLFFRSSRNSPAIRLLLIAGSASTLAYFLQGTGWYYQQLPAISFFAAAGTLQLLDHLEHLSSRLESAHSADAAERPAFGSFRIPNWAVAATAALSILALALTTHFTNYPFTADRAFAIDTPDPAFFRDLPPGTPIATLTTSVDATMMPVERYHLTWAQRTTALWLLPAILRSEAAPQPHLTPLHLARLEALQHQWMLEDLKRWHPQLILIHRCQDPAISCQLLEDRHDNILAFFLRDPAFATLWSHYHYTRSLGPFDAYTLTP